MSTHISRLLKAARENIDQLPVDYADAEDPDFSQGDLLNEQEEAAYMAVESIARDSERLDRLNDAIKDIPLSKATPELIEVVQASLVSPEEPSIATESDDPGAWDKTKQFTTKAMKVTGQALKSALEALIEMIEKIFGWIVDTRKGTAKRLAAMKQALSQAPNSAKIEPARFKTLMYRSAFNTNTIKQVLGRYAEVATATNVAVSNTLIAEVVNMFATKAVIDLPTAFMAKTQGAFKWKSTGPLHTATVYDGEGGMYIDINVRQVTGIGMSIVNTAKDSDPNVIDAGATAAEFNKNDITSLITMGESLLNGVARLEPGYNATRANLRKLMGHTVVTQGALTIGGRPATSYIAELRGYLNLASKYGTNVALKAAHEVGYLAEAFVKTGQAAQTDSAEHALSGA